MIYYKQEKFNLAEIHFKKALSINPQSSVLLCHIGVVCCQLLAPQAVVSHWVTTSISNYNQPTKQNSHSMETLVPTTINESSPHMNREKMRVISTRHGPVHSYFTLTLAWPVSVRGPSSNIGSVQWGWQPTQSLKLSYTLSCYSTAISWLGCVGVSPVSYWEEADMMNMYPNWALSWF